MGRVEEKKKIEEIDIEELRPSKEEIKLKVILYAKRFKPLRELLIWIWKHRYDSITSDDLMADFGIKRELALYKLNYLANLGILEKFGSKPKVFRVFDEKMLEEIVKELGGMEE